MTKAPQVPSIGFDEGCCGGSADARSGGALILESLLTCPQCGHEKREQMRVDACQFLYECEGCLALLRPKHGDCCVFCSYGSEACPPIQTQRRCSDGVERATGDLGR